jgi:hypothetical protein
MCIREHMGLARGRLDGTAYTNCAELTTSFGTCHSEGLWEDYLECECSTWLTRPSVWPALGRVEVC